MPLGAKEKKKENKPSERGPAFEYCEVCRRNHDGGRRHRYSAGHRRALAAALDRFGEKLVNVRFFLLHPAPLRPDLAAANRLWCLFCAEDLRELGSPFACWNAIYHLASTEHLEKLRDFMRRHGGGLDKVDSFRVSESELIKWEKGCGSLKNAASSSSEGPIGPSPGPPKDIQHELTSNNKDNYKKTTVQSFNPSVSHAVTPLQSLTDEGYRVCPPEVSGATAAGSTLYAATSLSAGLQGSMGFQDTSASRSAAGHLAGNQATPFGNNQRNLIGRSLSTGPDRRNDSGGHFAGVLQGLASISLPSEGCQANVHTGAPPPWLDTNEENETNLVNRGLEMNKVAFPLAQTRKSRKLNPKRVGAAWAEKRRAELEREKRGEIVANSCDANWLPNFGRVWQAGTRKESRKEFEKEKQKLLNDDHQFDLLSTPKPYISKRMRMNSGNDGTVNGKVEGNSDAF